jgi:hypothetical protein
VFHYFTIKFHFSFFASFRFKFFASLHLSNFRFEAEQSEAKFKSIFSLFFLLFSFFFALNFSLRFDLVIYALKRNKAKRNSSLIFCFFAFFHFFRFFHFFLLNFRFASIFSPNFRLFYLRFRFRFLGVSHQSESCEIRLFFSLGSETKFSLQFQISLPKRK